MVRRIPFLNARLTRTASPDRGLSWPEKAEIEMRCLNLVKQLDLCFGTIDLVLTPDGRYVFVEINPSGQWRWVETMAGLPIAAAMADYLIEADRSLDPLERRSDLRAQECGPEISSHS